MAKRLFTSSGLTFTASNAGSAITTASSYMALKGGTGTQMIDILEVMITGKTSVSTIGGMQLNRVSTVEGTLTTLAANHSDGPMHPSTAVLTNNPLPFVTVSAGAHPTPSNTVSDARLNLGANLYGGIVRWAASPTQQWTQLGNTASNGESIIHNNALAGGVTGAADAHIIYEPY